MKLSTLSSLLPLSILPLLAQTHAFPQNNLIGGAPSSSSELPFLNASSATSTPTFPTSTSTATPYPSTAASTFKLQTRLSPPSPSNPNPLPKFSSLYLTSYAADMYHFDTALLSAPGNDFWLNGSSLQVVHSDPFLWGLQFEFSPYAGWASVRMDWNLDAAGGFVVIDDPGGAGGGGKGVQLVLGFRGDGVGSDMGGRGWLVCDWWRAVPQLFFRDPYRHAKFYPAPCNCAEVDLVLVFDEEPERVIGGG